MMVILNVHVGPLLRYVIGKIIFYWNHIHKLHNFLAVGLMSSAIYDTGSGLIVGVMWILIRIPYQVLSASYFQNELPQTDVWNLSGITSCAGQGFCSKHIYKSVNVWRSAHGIGFQLKKNHAKLLLFKMEVQWLMPLNNNVISCWDEKIGMILTFQKNSTKMREMNKMVDLVPFSYWCKWTILKTIWKVAIWKLLELLAWQDAYSAVSSGWTNVPLLMILSIWQVV